MRMLLPATALLLAMTALHARDALDAPLVGENLIENGSFELSPIGPVDAGEVPEGWLVEAYGRDGQLTIVQDAAPGEGAQSVQMTNTPEDSKTGLHGPFIEIDPTQAYVQFGWMKIAEDAEPYRLLYGRQWFDAERKPCDQEHSRSYNYTPQPDTIPARWQFTKQLFLPDQTPDDGRFASDEIPANARYLKIWALAYDCVGTGYFDGLGLYRVDYGSVAREAILGAMEEADADAIRAEIEAMLADLPGDHSLYARAQELLAELARVRSEATQDQQRHVHDWIADRKRAPELMDELDSLRWEMKIEALLRTAG
ncbi:MAG: hypothetical protein GF393_02850 [Armatimonadia bacterium]|nr:hypothetical protein [Armatimonadia bacterium]